MQTLADSLLAGERPPQIVQIATGALTLTVDRSDWPPDDLCAIATRINPRRAFIIVSRVLGRHLPTRPATMRATFRDLAARIPADLPGPVLVIGLAETAICLGQGVHEELRRLRDDALFLHTTRQRLDHALLCRFQEPHSHASAHLIYCPDRGQIDLAAIRSLVLVDDEISTGSTLGNLSNAVVGALPAIEAIAVATLTDWSGGSDWLGRMPRPSVCVALLTGSLRWHGQARSPASLAARCFDAAAPSLGLMSRHHNFGRFGRAGIASERDSMLDAIRVPRNGRIGIIGTGEFLYPPFRIAEALEAQGYDVLVQSTTRSPIMPGGPISSQLRFADNYQTRVPNFLYNAEELSQRALILCHETPPGSVDPALLEAIGGQALFFGDSI
jgi:hypothetical protein